MIILSATTDSLECVTALVGASIDVDMHCSWNDYDGTTTFVPGRTNTGNVTSATTTTLLAAPGSGHYRNAKTINIRNTHATLAAVVTVQFNQNSTIIELHKATLAAGEALEYIEGVGFFILGATNPNYVLSLSADQSNSTTTLTEVTGLTMALPTGNFVFNYYLRMQSAATTTGHRFSVNHDGTVTAFLAHVMWPGGTTASADAVDQDFVAAGGQLLSGFMARAKSTTGWGTTLSVDTANADILIWIPGMMVVTVAGNLELWHGSEVAAASTVMAGSCLVVSKCG